MRILYLPAYFFPEKAASNYLNENRNQAFADAGIDMTVFVPSPSRGISPEERIKYCSSDYREENLYNGHMQLHRFSMYAERRNPLLRALRYVFCWIKQFNRGLISKDIDCIFLASTPPIQGVLGACLKFFKRVPFVYNLQDIFPDSLVGTGMTHKGSLLWKIGRSIENFTYRNADKIIVISEDFKRNVIAKGVPEDKIEIIYNWVDEKAITPVNNVDNPLYIELGLQRDIFRIVYAGNLGNAQNISIILDAASKLKDVADLEFLIFGTGGIEDEIRERIEKEMLTNVRLLPLQPYEKVKYVYSMGDACVVSCKAGLGGSAMPSKTWSILSCGRPVIASFDEGELKTILENHKCGVFTKAGDTNSFVEGILKLYNDRELCKEYGANGRKFILENLTKEVGTARYVEVIKEVVSSHQKKTPSNPPA